MVWTWHLEQRDRVNQAKPNASHFALAKLEQHWEKHRDDFTIVT